jgi:putative peptide zinc metalloprotease protein
VIGLVPIWPRYVQARVELEPVRREIVRTAVPGNVVAVFVREGDHVVPGQSLVQLQDYGIESKFHATGSNLVEAKNEEIRAQLDYNNAGAAMEQRRQSAVEASTSRQAMDSLTPAAAIRGVVASNRITDLKGTYLETGSVVAEIADTSAMRARIFVPEFEVNHVRPGQDVRLLLDGRYSPISGAITEVVPASSVLTSGLESATAYKGLANMRFYVAEAILPNDGNLRDQMSGTAKIRIGRQSIASMVGRELSDFVGRKVW